MSPRRLLATLLLLACAVPLLADHQTHEPQAVYGTITGWDAATKRITLLEGTIVVDASTAHIFDTTGLPGVPPAVGLQAKIILKPGPYTPGTPLPAALVELTTRTPASMAGTVTSIDVAQNTFVAAGMTIKVTPETKWRGGVDVRSIAQLQVGHAISAELVLTPGSGSATLNDAFFRRSKNGGGNATGSVITATEIFVVGFIPPMGHETFGKAIAVEGDTWVVRDRDNKSHVFKTFERTIYNSNTAVEAVPKAGEYVSVKSYPDDHGVEIAYVISVWPPPQQWLDYDFGVYGTLVEINDAGKFLAIKAPPSDERVEFAITADTGYYLGAKIGDYVEVRADLPKVNDRAVALQVIKTSRVVRMSFQGTVQKIENGTWTVDGWTVLVTPQTVLINNPRVGDVVRITGETEHGSRTIKALTIERL